jgi:hypothetical protein
MNRYSDELRAGLPMFDSREGKHIFLLSTASRPSLGPTWPPIHWVPGVKRPGPEAEVKSGEANSPVLHTSSWRGANEFRTGTT